MDVYPEIAVRAGLLREGSVVERVFRSISRFTLREADTVVVLGDDMKEVALRAGAEESKVIVVRNWADHNKIRPIPPDENPLRKSWGLEGKFVVEYSGNLGVSHFFKDLLPVAESLADHEDICFVFIGDGERRTEVEAYVSSRRLSNVMLLPYQDSSLLSQSLSVGDLHYVSLQRGFEGLVVPSKAYGIMAAGRPIVYQGAENGEIARMVVREGIGRVIPPGDRGGLRDCILSLYRDRENRLTMGAAARRVLEEKYPAAKGLALYRKVLAGEQ
jgi:glycosyltransferase involved in cell wall biosynthesis